MNLNETWKLCLSMWQWIAEERRKGNTKNVVTLKEEWLQKHGFKEDSVRCNCFFCEYDTKYQTTQGDCHFCPGKKVDKSFRCVSPDYNFGYEPIAFYNKLRSLNRKRTAKK